MIFIGTNNYTTTALGSVHEMILSKNGSDFARIDFVADDIAHIDYKISYDLMTMARDIGGFVFFIYFTFGACAKSWARHDAKMTIINQIYAPLEKPSFWMSCSFCCRGQKSRAVSETLKKAECKLISDLDIVRFVKQKTLAKITINEIELSNASMLRS